MRQIKKQSQLYNYKAIFKTSKEELKAVVGNSTNEISPSKVRTDIPRFRKRDFSLNKISLWT